ncbi:MAG: ATP-dependent zinc metalloprotease FtsH [Anaerolineae bacterium]|nr:ATP-dependent zinc metalloprotease FtsH [Anaerolineae bacterium]
MYAPQTISIPQMAHAVEAGEVKSLVVQGDLLIGTTANGDQVRALKERGISAIDTLQFFSVSTGTLRALPLLIEESQSAGFDAHQILLTLTMLAFVGYLLVRYPRWFQDNGWGLPFFNTRRSKPLFLSGSPGGKDDKARAPRVTFQDVAGTDQAKLELQEIIEFLKEPSKFAKLGARIPKGVLMAGPPGTGKTLLAKAVAGEAGVPFFSISGSEFVEMYVGVGAARVRDLFKQARKHSPAVVFVDEIDAVGRQRGASNGHGNDEREQTLNQILVEMDGFTTDTSVIVMASTNRPDILDPALLRPGRFDRKVFLDRPDVQSREAILAVHLRGKPLDPAISIAEVARLTPGFVGADLENLVNEAAILAARRGLAVIGRAEFQDAMERIVAGPERQNKILSKLERDVVAYHEAGHAVVMHNLEHCDPVHKVSIVSRGMALGYTMPLPEGDKYLRRREAFEDEIVGLLGGRAAEEIIFNQVTTGASNDLERATRLARAMVTRYGFSQTLGLRTFGEEQGNAYLGSLGEARDYSEEKARAIDQEIDQILSTAYQRAKTLLAEHRSQLDGLAVALLEVETIERPAFEALMA